MHCRSSLVNKKYLTGRGLLKSIYPFWPQERMQKIVVTFVRAETCDITSYAPTRLFLRDVLGVE
jgi:hypothetical protein